MKIVIVGAGEIGTHIAISLAEENHEIVIIEFDDKIAEELNHEIDARVMVADGTSISVLIEAGTADCDLFLSLTNDDNTNLVSASIAKKLGAVKTICRVHPRVQRDSIFVDFGDHFGIDHLFSSERLSAVELAMHVRNPRSSMVEDIAQGYVEIQRAYVSERSAMSGKTLGQIRFPPRVRVGAITRGNHSIVPTASDKLESGDLVTLFGDPAKLHDTVLKLQSNTGKEERSNIVIFGGGEYGFSLAQTLESWNCRIRIMEKDPQRCQELSDTLTNVTILNADATSISEMREEQVGDADFFIAATPDDEDNVMSCLQAHTLGTRYCLPLIHRADYADALTRVGDKLGILAAVSPREATRKALHHFITSDRFHLLKKLEGVELIESSVNEASGLIGHKVRDVPWPPGCVLVAMVHGNRGHVPMADDIINGEDSLYAIVTPKAKRVFLELVSP